MDRAQPASEADFRPARPHAEVMVVPLIGFLGGQELLIIALILLVLFGGTKIPSLMRGMGQGIREFRKELKNPGSEDSAEEEETKEGR